jgi:hypothetical protein
MSGTYTVELEVSEPLYHWLELEAVEHGHDSVADEIQHVVRLALQRDLSKQHGIDAPVEIDLPEDVIERLQCLLRDLEAGGADVDHMEDHVLNHVNFDIEFTHGGEPIRWEAADD